jgi:dihydrofolate synthase/folylpolyglutamate synthase
MRSLDEWLAYQAKLHPRSIDLGLERLGEVIKRLKFKQSEAPVITIAGTNGKGSVSAYCSNILRAQGYRVGTFTSPHLRDYRERIRVHDRDVTEAELIQAFERIEAARGEVGLTYFEFNTLAALLVFQSASLDAWVMEIGMGGRLDAVNILEPSVAVVVSIGLDHQEHLGPTLEAIAREKAGIFRAKVPAVIGARAPHAVLESEARACGARLKRLGIEYNYIREGSGWRYRGLRWHLPLLPAPALLGETQFGNAAIALAALEELDSRLPVSPDALATGLATVSLGGRFQLARQHADDPTFIFDVAHNADSAAVLAENLKATFEDGKTLAVCGILGDKDVGAIAASLGPLIAEWWCASLEGPRGQPGAKLVEALQAHVTTPLHAADSVAAACEAAAARATAKDRVAVFGSFHTVGPALDWFEARERRRAQGF